jgi:cytochrome c
MKICVALILALLVSAALAQPDEFDRGYALAAKKGCLDCHALGYAYVGPSFTSIADHYRHDPEAPGQIAEVIQAGSRGHWGERFNMWPQVHVTPDELQRLVRWVLMQ